jgi:hypothetical protein
MLEKRVSCGRNLLEENFREWLAPRRFLLEATVSPEVSCRRPYHLREIPQWHISSGRAPLPEATSGPARQWGYEPNLMGLCATGHFLGIFRLRENAFRP